MYCVHTDGRVNDEVGDGGRLEAVAVTQGKEGHRCEREGRTAEQPEVAGTGDSQEASHRR